MLQIDAPPVENFTVPAYRNAALLVRRTCKGKGKGKRSIAVRRRLTATGTHMPYGITQYYLPPGRGDIPALYPSRSWYSIKRPRRDARLS